MNVKFHSIISGESELTGLGGVHIGTILLVPVPFTDYVSVYKACQDSLVSEVQQSSNILDFPTDHNQTMAKLRAQVGVNHVGIDLYLERKICASRKSAIRE